MTDLPLPDNLLLSEDPPEARDALAPSNSTSPEVLERKVIDYYREVTFGYRDWSPNINMHFGIFEWGINPFRLEALLENTNRCVFRLLNLKGSRNHLLDMGCGLGATARFCARQAAVEMVTGITLVESQVQEAQEFSQGFAGAERIKFIQENFHCTSFADDSFDGAYAIESACHSVEKDKRSFLKEALRVLKPGASLVVCDAFSISSKPLNPLLNYCYRKTCEHWSVGNFADLKGMIKAMQELGFQNIRVRNVSWRIGPSALYVPWVTVKFFFKLLLTGDKNPQHWHHLLAPIFAAPLALHPGRFGYFLVTGDKPQKMLAD